MAQIQLNIHEGGLNSKEIARLNVAKVFFFLFAKVFSFEHSMNGLGGKSFTVYTVMAVANAIQMSVFNGKEFKGTKHSRRYSMLAKNN